MSQSGLRFSLSTQNMEFSEIKLGSIYKDNDIHNLTFIGVQPNNNNCFFKGIVNQIDFNNKINVGYSNNFDFKLSPYDTNFDPIKIEKKKIFDFDTEEILHIKFKTDIGNINLFSSSIQKWGIDCNFFTPSSKIYIGINDDFESYSALKFCTENSNFIISSNFSSSQINDITLWGFLKNSFTQSNKIGIGCSTNMCDDVKTLYLTAQNETYDIGFKTDTCKEQLTLGTKYNININQNTKGDAVVEIKDFQFKNFTSQTSIELKDKYSLSLNFSAGNDKTNCDIDFDFYKNNKCIVDQSETEHNLKM